MSDEPEAEWLGCTPAYWGLANLATHVPQTLEQQVAALEILLAKTTKCCLGLEQEIFELMEVRAKQRAVNEILLRYNDDDPVLSAALREALK